MNEVAFLHVFEAVCKDKVVNAVEMSLLGKITRTQGIVRLFKLKRKHGTALRIYFCACLGY